MNYFKKKVALALTMSMTLASLPITSLASDKGFDISKSLDKVDTNIGDSEALLREKSKDFAESLKKLIESGNTDELLDGIKKGKSDLDPKSGGQQDTPTPPDTEDSESVNPQNAGHINVSYVDARNRKLVGNQVFTLTQQGLNTVSPNPPKGFKFENELDAELSVNAEKIDNEIHVVIKVVPSVIKNIDDIYTEPREGLLPPAVNEPEIDDSYVLDKVQTEYDKEDPEEVKKYRKEKLEEFKKYLQDTKALVTENTDVLFRNREKYRDDQTLDKSLEKLIHEIEEDVTPKETIKAEVDSFYDYMKTKSNMVFMDWLTTMIYNQEINPVEVRNVVDDLSDYIEKYKEVSEIANIYKENRSELSELVFRNYNELLAQHAIDNDLAITVNKKMSQELIEKTDLMLKDLLFAKSELVNAVSKIEVKEIPTHEVEEWASSFAEYSAQIETLKDLEVDRYYKYLKTELGDLNEIILKLNIAKDKQDKVFGLSLLLEEYNFQSYKVRSLIELAPELVTITGSFNNTGNADTFLNEIMQDFESASKVEDIKVALDKNKANALLYIKSGDLNTIKYNAYTSYEIPDYEELISRESRTKHKLYKTQMLNKLYEVIDKIEEPKISKEKVKLVTDLSKLLSLKSNSSIDSEAAKTFTSIKFKFKDAEKQEKYDRLFKLAEKLSKIYDQTQEGYNTTPNHIKKINDKYEEYATIENIMKEDVKDLSQELEYALNELKIWDKGLETEIDFLGVSKEIYNFFKTELKSEDKSFENPVSVFSQETLQDAQAYIDGYSKNMSLVRNSEYLVVKELSDKLEEIKELKKLSEEGVDFEIYYKTINDINQLLSILKQDKLDDDRAIEMIFSRVESIAKKQGLEKEGYEKDLQTAVVQFKKLTSSNVGKERDFVIMAELFARKYVEYLKGVIEKPVIFEFDEKTYRTPKAPEVPKAEEPKKPELPDKPKVEEPPKVSPGTSSGSGGSRKDRDRDREEKQPQVTAGTTKVSVSDSVVGKIELPNTPANTVNYDSIKLEGIAEGKWYTTAFKKMAQRGYIRNKKYDPNAEASRAFVVGTLSRVSQKGGVASNNPFIDVKNANLKNALNWAVASGVVTVGKDKKFNPQAPITRAQMAVLIYKFVNINVLNLVPNKDIPEYKDSKLPKWAKESIYNVSKLGYMTPDKNGKFNPDKKMTNAEFIALMERVITDLGL